jgi:ATP phosphoribosyltransferase regulatory subunit
MSVPLHQTRHRALLPVGLPDVLPPDAGHEAALMERLMASFASHGYQRVKPPLLEFTDSLLAGIGADTTLSHQTFRVLDPQSGMMMGIRPDFTPQVARIAGSRLSQAPRPLRLAYCGQVLRVASSQIQPERQIDQVGVELIGASQPEADAEIILLAANSLAGLGIISLSVDLCMPTLVPTLCQAWGLDPDTTERLRQALDRKDAAGVAAVGGEPALVLGRLMAAAGLADGALETLEAMPLPAAAEPDRQHLAQVVRLVRHAAPHLMVTLDLVEYRGFEYQDGVSFTLFSRGRGGESGSGLELGNGGRYRAGATQDIRGEKDIPGEPATGFTLYANAVVKTAPPPEARSQVYLPHGTDPQKGEQLRADGWVTLAGLALLAEAEAKAEAIRLGCGFIVTSRDARPVKLADDGSAKTSTP